MKVRDFFGKDKQNRQIFSQNHQEKERPQINKIKNKRGDVTSDTTEMQNIIRLLLRTIIHQQIEQPKING